MQDYEIVILLPHAGFKADLGRKAQLNFQQSQMSHQMPQAMIAEKPPREGEIVGYEFVNAFSYVLLGIFVVVGVGLILHGRYKRLQTIRGKQGI